MQYFAQQMVGIETIYLLDLCQHSQWTQVASHESPSLVLVAWVAYSDWVINPSLVAGFECTIP